MAGSNATVHGWLTEDRNGNVGTSPDDIGNLLQYYNVPCHMQPQASVEGLVRELSLGHKVIVGVDSGDLWGVHDAFNEFIDHHADHAIWVTGVDFTDPQHPKVIINDSGVPDGRGKAYDLELFTAAWRHGGFEYCATDNPPPHFADSCAAFDPSVGYFPDLAGYFDANFHGFANTLHTTAIFDRPVTPASAGDPSFQLRTTPLENLTDETQNAIFRAI